MHLKSIEIVGYKSFADKTRLEFEPGITGIVGPNGCGKSNIIDAVRWCLGEMSWKSLRAGAMTDVIFAGSERRSPLGMTDVTLVFDNAKNLLPVAYSEVTVTRRIYRSGESEYYLNKTQCRLKDIRELFLDTGIGSDGYAIIDQGGVEFVLRASPEERRSLFEEAAGVAKFKAKREEALKKLEHVEADLGRLKDSVALIAEQVKKLDAEARKAKLYQKYKEELTSLEVCHVLAQVDELERQLKDVVERSKPYQETLGQLTASGSAEGAHLAALNLEKANQQNVVIESNKAVSGAQEQIGRLEERMLSADRAVLDSQRRRTECESELGAARGRLDVIDPEIDGARQALGAAESALTGVQEEVDKSQAHLEGIDARAHEAQARLEGLQEQRKTLREESLLAARAVGVLESDVAHQIGLLRSTLRSLAKEADAAESLRTATEAQRGALEGQRAVVESARQEAGRCDEGLADARRRLAATSDELSGLDAQAMETRLKVQSLESEGQKDPYWSGAQAVVNAGLDGVLGMVSDLVNVKESHRAFLGDALGERLHAVVCEDSAAAQAGIDLLASTGRGRARFLVLTSIPASSPGRTYPANARPLLDHVSFEPRFEATVRFLLEESYVLGKAIYGDHWICGGATDASRERPSLLDLGEFRARGKALEVRRGELAGVKAGMEAEAAQWEGRCGEARMRSDEAVGTQRDLATRLSSAEASLSVQAGNVGTTTSEAAEFLRGLAAMKERLASARGAKAEVEAKALAVDGGESALRDDVAACERELSQARAVQATAEARVQTAAAAVDLRRQTLEQRLAEKEGLVKTVSSRQEELQDLERRRAESEAAKAAAGAQRESLAAGLKSLERQAKESLDRLHDLQTLATEKELVINQLNVEIGRTKDKLTHYEMEAGSAKTRQDMHKKRLWEDWQLTEAEARQRNPGVVPVDQERIETLRKRIAGMGNINMAAPEDYEVLSAKQSTLTAQIDDMTKAKEDLKAAIQKINGTTRENFRQTFMEVREHFRRFYGILFEGGEADLVLQDPENLLETGIDIVAQPPGKKLQHLSLLSGGEKSLTAIALLFAFFTVRPSPFCCLDEADHALDDANIERFASLVREFQSRTQFLIVSHNKRTMEAAEAIYGVTMEEKGVSQIVAIDFKKRQAPPPAVPAAAAAPSGPEGASDPAAAA
ncbi:MAG: chromosome segregation protein SMC [Elusimicrobia bacterium]|nr:chromosome segregation protein SMC [Elusimicrobiota bacterium]